MSQRKSGYERVERDQYETPAWVTEALLSHLLPHTIRSEFTPISIWEPACGSGKMVDVLCRTGCRIITSDIAGGRNFLSETGFGSFGVVTNPPYSHAKEFIEHALAITRPHEGFVAMLLRTDYDHAKTRTHLFHGCPAFAKKLVLTKRIVWFERKGAAPSFNHAWYIWDWKHHGPPTLAYGPQ